MKLGGFYTADLSLILNELPSFLSVKNILNYPHNILRPNTAIILGNEGFNYVLSQEGFKSGDFDQCLYEYLKIKFPDLISGRVITKGKIDGKLYFMLGNGGFHFHADLFLFPDQLYFLPKV